MNALGRLRTRLGVALDELARRLRIPLADVNTIELTELRLLDVDTLRQYLGALGCRLDLVACHIDGEAIWLSDEDAPPECPDCGMQLAQVAGPGSGRGWTCLRCEVPS